MGKLKEMRIFSKFCLMSKQLTIVGLSIREISESPSSGL